MREVLLQFQELNTRTNKRDSIVSTHLEEGGGRRRRRRRRKSSSQSRFVSNRNGSVSSYALQDTP
jgi:hypothetical protein